MYGSTAFAASIWQPLVAKSSLHCWALTLFARNEKARRIAMSTFIIGSGKKEIWMNDDEYSEMKRDETKRIKNNKFYVCGLVQTRDYETR
mmetsp:Transcript_52237/g.126230  ORF Transcript_52237/g.126230 Transcript_52237/m.126230 type:complete len:90 (+) Transcript_52237:3445-3714(+)